MSRHRDRDHAFALALLSMGALIFSLILLILLKGILT